MVVVPDLVKGELRFVQFGDCNAILLRQMEHRAHERNNARQNRLSNEQKFDLAELPRRAATVT